MTEIDKRFVEFSKPFVNALKETFKVMMQTELSAHSPKVKQSATTNGEITATIGMNGKVTSNGEKKDFKGQIGVSFPMDVYLKTASAMLMEEYNEYNDEIADTGGEIINIVMGNSKQSLFEMGYEIEMASPSTIKGKDIEIKYPKGTTTIEISIESQLGMFFLEICYLEV